MNRRSALALLSVLPLSCKRKSNVARVGSKNFSESVLLGEIVAQQLERRAGVSVERKPNLGGTFVCHQAIVSGDLDVYVEYTGTAYSAILKRPLAPLAAVDIRGEVEKAWPEKFNAVWMPPLGFDDTFAILVRRADAESKKLKTVSDVIPHASSMRPGFGYEFVERADGYDAFTSAYSLKFGSKPATMELSLTYRALADNKVDLIAGNSTDGLIEKLDLVQLVDDKHFFPPYEAAPVVRRTLIDTHPSVAEALRALSGKIDSSTMRRLNRAVDVEGRAVSEVARGFLAGVP